MARQSKSSQLKYASRFVCDRMNIIIEEKLKNVKKNSKSLKKWLHKMQFSILRKVSEASKSIFFSKCVPSSEKTKDHIEQLKTEIEEKIKAIEKSVNSPLDLPSSPTLDHQRDQEKYKEISSSSSSVEVSLEIIREKLRELNTTYSEKIRALQGSFESYTSRLSKQQSSDANITAQDEINITSSQSSTISSSLSSTAITSCSLAIANPKPQRPQAGHLQPLIVLEEHLNTE